MNAVESLERAKILRKNGAVVFRILTPEQVKYWKDRIAKEIAAGCEFSSELKAGNIADAQGGSFKAFGTPTTFHCSAVRDLRHYIHVKLRFFFSFLCTLYKLKNMELLLDRFRLQPIGTISASEKWHRDQPAESEAKQQVLQGWLNLSEPNATQTFRHLPGTQLASLAGFIKADPTKAQLATATDLTIQPGEFVFFDPTLIHAVAAIRRLRTPLIRLHLGVRLSNSDVPLFELDKVFNKFHVPREPSGELPRTWPRLYLVNWHDKLQEVSNSYDPRYLVKHTIKGGKSAGKVLTVVPAHLHKLKKCDRKQFRAYREVERRLYYPHIPKTK